MGTVDLQLAIALRDRPHINRAVETGTWRGATARALAGVFPSVVTVELSDELHRLAREMLMDMPHVHPLVGDSVSHLPRLAGERTPTLYFLDGHWSAGDTAGFGHECPVIREIEAIGPGHADDCLIIDDARLFTSAPPPPHDASQWPMITEVFDAIRTERPDHVITVLDDQIVAVPRRVKSTIDAYGLQIQRSHMRPMPRLALRANRLLERVGFRLRGTLRTGR